ncbi:hypothetical protein CYPRO_1838 [Cyclonatronum proteinivorum]|uniref:Uncharacterized protein n=1 Tax=Cyclonatronum proteinivorum TaxID=1457365 RepID=A0A345UKT6_9BACT|nr:hypothetical protein [Cyclonatronum proteinivorum]AXJ01088.1 hypothetical protein CYPRO_1838 [Cyclonatronum proteinivorum]
MRLLPFLFVFSLLLSSFLEDAEARQHSSNEALLMQEALSVLSESRILTELSASVGVQSNLPERNRQLLFNELMRLGKQVRLDSDGMQLQVMVYPRNSLRQLNPNEAERLISGEVQLFLTDASRNLTDTETLSFRYSDTIPFENHEALISDWPATRFHETEALQQRNRWREWGQPAIIAAATGVTVYLLFNIRSS